MDRSLPGSSVHGDSPGKNTEVGSHSPSPGDLPNPGIEPRSPALQVDSLPSETPWKPLFDGVPTKDRVPLRDLPSATKGERGNSEFIHFNPKI